MQKHDFATINYFAVWEELCDRQTDVFVCFVVYIGEAENVSFV